MHTDHLRLDLANRRRLLASCILGMALYTLVIVVLYPSFKNTTSLDDLTRNGSTLAALFGVTGSITSPSGWLDANIYQNFLPLIMLVLTIGHGAWSVAGQDEDGTLGPTVTLPEFRRSIIAQKAGAMVLQAASLALAVAVCVFVGRSFDLRLDPGHVATVSFTVLLLGVDIGLVALAIGAGQGAAERLWGSPAAWRPPRTWSARSPQSSAGCDRCGIYPSSTGQWATTSWRTERAPSTWSCSHWSACSAWHSPLSRSHVPI